MSIRTEPSKASQWLEKAGLRPTRQRVVLANVLVGDGQHRHVSAESLYSEVLASGEKVALATVYNTLRAFCEAGLVQEVSIDGSKSYFDTRTDEHPHFYWSDRNQVTDAPNAELKIAELPTPPEGMEIDKVDVVIRLRPKKRG